MKYLKKSLGQNFLIDKNIIKKIVSLTNFENKNIIEIGPGKGILTDEILTKKPKSLIVIEKDDKLANDLNTKYSYNKIVKVINEDFLKFNLDNIDKKNLIIVGN
jgi:16S rRNA (adenine1518-N6/adenine1519-N6)-dimethyltransferase